jgi:hypothetical protein
LTIGGYLAVLGYMIYILVQWSTHPLAVSVSLVAQDRLQTSTVNIACTSACGCAVNYAFRDGPCAQLQNFTIGSGQRKEVVFCTSSRWSEGVVINGAVSASKIGESVVLFEADPRVQEDGKSVLTPLPGTTLINDPAALAARKISKVRTKVVTFRQTNFRDLTKSATDLAIAYAIAYSSDGSICPTRAPICNLVEAVDFDNKDELEGLAELSGLSDSITQSLLKDLSVLSSIGIATQTATAPTFTLPGLTPPLRRRQAPNTVVPTQDNTLSSCYVLQKDTFLLDFETRSSFSWAGAISEFGGAHGTAFLVAGWIALAASCVGLRKPAKQLAEE